jgi:hypothetical protein
MKMTALWDVAPCSLVEIDRRFGGALMNFYGRTPKMEGDRVFASSSSQVSSSISKKGKFCILIFSSVGNRRFHKAEGGGKKFWTEIIIDSETTRIN